MHPFYFNTTERRLFGVYHAAEGRPARPAGVVVCPPFGHEYVRSYRALRNVAAQLAKSGCHVLRFDYFGTGDSAGDGRDGRLGGWLDDIAAAVAELKDTADVTRVSLFGLRLGGALAVAAASARMAVDALTLWDPILRGQDYVEGMAVLQRDWLKNRPQLQLSATERAVELLGFALTAELREDLAGIDLWHLPRLRARRVAVLLSEERPETERWIAGLAESGVVTKCRHVPSAGEWDRTHAAHRAFFPPPAVLQGVVTAVCEDVQ